MALALTERVHGRELAESLQLVIEYDPQPPFETGSPTKTDASTLRLALRVLLGDHPCRWRPDSTATARPCGSDAPAARALDDQQVDSRLSERLHKHVLGASGQQPQATIVGMLVVQRS